MPATAVEDEYWSYQYITGDRLRNQTRWWPEEGAQGFGTMQEALDGMRLVAAELAKATDVPPHYVTPLAPHPAQPLEEA